MIEINPIAFVKNSIESNFEGPWADIISEIILIPEFSSNSLKGLNDFSHAEIIFYFDKLDSLKVCKSSRHPKDNLEWPDTGIFAQRGSLRPNLLAATIVRIISVEDRKIIVSGLDAFNATPVIDIKPVMKEFLPPESVMQPKWSSDLMKNYF